MGKIKRINWDLKSLYKSDNDPRILKDKKEIENEAGKFIAKWKNRNDYLKNPEILKQALDEYERLMKYYAGGGSWSYYFFLKSELDKNDPIIKAKLNQAVDFASKMENEMQFFELRIQKISGPLQKKFLNYPGLSQYKHFLERNFNWAKHALSEPEEKILNLKSVPAYSNWVNMVDSLLSKEEAEIFGEDGRKRKRSMAEIGSLINSREKKTRDAAASALNRILAKYDDVAENEINAILKNKKIDDELRKLERPDSARHLADDLDNEIVDSLRSAVSNRFEISKRYYRLKAKMFGVKKLAYHERNVPYGNLGKKYSFGKAFELVGKVFENLDSEFAEIYRKFFEEKRVDAFAKKGKETGAFCIHGLPPHPVFILLNFDGSLSDVCTIAHEMGHGINDELMKKQNALNFGTTLATAETASTFMEDFVIQNLIAKADEETQLALMMDKLNSDVSTIFRQIACYNFELELHKNFRDKGYLSKKEIGALFKKNMAAYMGNYVEQSLGSENWWIFWSHIRRFFYNYSYANGLLISKYLQSSVKKDPKFIGKVKEFLAAGLSDSPKNIFLKMGVDISDKNFWNRGLDEVNDLLIEAEKLAKKLKKI